MKIAYIEEKLFTQEQIQQLFLSINWMSGQYPSRLYDALMHSSTVITAWSGKNLVGLVRVLDDGGMLAYLHYLLVHPDYQGQGIAHHLVDMVKEKYRDFLYLEVMPEDSNNVPFYKRHGFSRMEDGTAMIIMNTAI